MTNLQTTISIFAATYKILAKNRLATSDTPLSVKHAPTLAAMDATGLLLLIARINQLFDGQLMAV